MSYRQLKQAVDESLAVVSHAAEEAEKHAAANYHTGQIYALTSQAKNALQLAAVFAQKTVSHVEHEIKKAKEALGA